MFNYRPTYRVQVAKLESLNMMTLLLAILKMSGAAQIGWAWVLAPYWIPAVLMLPFFILAVLEGN